jgi:hypothetical protein
VASQYSILRQYAPYVSPYNIDLVKDVMMYKQQKVDAAREKIYTQVDYLMGQEIDKPEARAYMEDKMSGVIANINQKFKGVDLSSDGVTRAIQGEISSVLDDTVINAIAGTKEGRRMHKMLSDLQINNPELYSAANAYAALKPYNEWVNDGKAGSRIAPLQYTPYTDYNKELKDRIDFISKLHKGAKVQIPILDKDGHPTGAVQEVTKDMFTPEQIASFALSGLSDKARQQMQVEAIYMVDSNPSLYSYDSVLGFMNKQISDKQRYVDALTADLSGLGSDPAKKEMVENEIKRAKSEIASMKSEFSRMDERTYDPYLGAMKVIENNFINNAAASYAYDNSSFIIKADELYWKTKEYNQRERLANLNFEKWKIEFEHERNRDIAEFEYGKNKDEARIAKLMSSGAGAAGGRAGSRAMQVGVGTNSGGTISANPIETKNISISEETHKKFNKAYTDLVTSGSRLSTALGAENMKNIQAAISRNMTDETSGYKYLMDEEKLLKYIKDNGGLSNDMFDKLPMAERKAATDAYMQLNSAVDKMDIENDRIKKENKIYDNIVSEIANAIARKEGGKPEEYIAYATALSLNDILRKNRGIVGDVESGVRYYEKGFSPVDIATIRKRVKNDGIDLSKVFERDSKSGRYFLKKYDDVKNSFSDGEEKVFFYTLYSISEMEGVGNYAVTDINIANQITKVQDDGINEIRKEYLELYSPNTVTYSTKLTSKEAGYREMGVLRDLFTKKMAEHPVGKSKSSSATIESFSLTESGIADNGEKTYSLVANHTGEREEIDIVEVSETELINNGIDPGINTPSVDIGGYESGIIRPTFGSDTNMWYPKMLENSDISPAYASVSSMMKVLSDMINESGNNLDDMPEQKVWLLNAAKDILDNSGKLGVKVEGYDPKTSYGYGYETRLYLMENGKPELIDSFDTPNVWFADNVSKELAVAPQKKIVDFVVAAITEEIKDMVAAKEGGNLPTSLNKNGKLMKLLNSVNRE